MAGMEGCWVASSAGARRPRARGGGCQAALRGRRASGRGQRGGRGWGTHSQSTRDIDEALMLGGDWGFFAMGWFLGGSEVWACGDGASWGQPLDARCVACGTPAPLNGRGIPAAVDTRRMSARIRPQDPALAEAGGAEPPWVRSIPRRVYRGRGRGPGRGSSPAPSRQACPAPHRANNPRQIPGRERPRSAAAEE